MWTTILVVVVAVAAAVGMFLVMRNNKKTMDGINRTIDSAKEIGKK